MQQIKRPSFVSLIIFSLLIIIGLQTTNSFADDFTLQKQHPAQAPTWPAVESAGAMEAIIHPGDEKQSLSAAYIGLPNKAAPITSSLAGETCQQMVANPQLDVLEFGDNSGSAEPWVVLDPSVYFGSDGTPPDYYLFLSDGDAGDTTPTTDAFGQGMVMPSNLSRIIVTYDTATANANTSDNSFGNLYTINAQGQLDQLIVWWNIADTAGVWENWTADITDPTFINPLKGQAMALVMDSITDGVGTAENTFFDNVTLTACVQSAATTHLYLPAIMHNFGVAAAPFCSPPTENPQDTFNANRGTEQTGAICNSDLSNIDRADYYTFKPTTSGNHTLHLRNLPAGTQWSAMIFIDSAMPDYAPGPTSNQCRIGTPGAGNKSVTCNLSSGQNYFIKVSAGGGYSGSKGTYEMQITSP